MEIVLPVFTHHHDREVGLSVESLETGRSFRLVTGMTKPHDGVRFEFVFPF